jgi:hypothetical protein
MISSPLTHAQARSASLSANLDAQIVQAVLASIPQGLGAQPAYTLRKAERPKVGRPRSLPVNMDDDKAVLQAKRQKRLKGDVLLKVLKDAKGDPKQALDILMQEMAREAVLIDADRDHYISRGKDTASLTARRITVLKNLSDQLIKRQDSSNGGKLDLGSRAVQKLYLFFTRKVKAACLQYGMQEEQVSTFLFKLSEEMASWEEEASKFLKSSE